MPASRTAFLNKSIWREPKSKEIQRISALGSEQGYEYPREIMPLWDSLSIKQKAAQMVMVYMTPASFMLEHEFGGYLVMKNHLKNLDKFTDNIRTVNANMRIKPLVAADQEGGLVNRISVISPQWEHTPSAKQMRAMSEDSIQALAKRIGAVLDSVGINLNLAPVLDPAKDSRGKNSFMEESRRSWGEDTLNAPKVRAFVQGMRESNVACASRITFIPPFRSRPRPISISRHCLSE